MPTYKKPSEIKAGVIGYGAAFNMGSHHLNEMARAGMVPTAVTDLDPKRLDAAAQDFPGIETYSSVADMLKKSAVNLLAIITPHNTHAKIALQCLRAGRHVVCEKPLAITTAECDAMIAAARKGKLVLSTYHNRHWDGSILEAVARIRKGVIGDVVRAEAHMGGWRKPGAWWRCSKSMSGGILYDWGVHLLEYSLQVMDAELDEVSGFARNGHWAPTSPWKEDTIEDEAMATVRFKDGRWMSLCMSSIESKPKDGMVEFTGTKGTYVMNGGDYQIITHKGKDRVVTQGPNRPSEGWKLYQNIADHLVKGEDLVITPEWARRPIHILDLANRSAKSGKALKAKYR